MKISRILAGVATAAVVTACASMGAAGFREPVVNLKDVTLNAVGLTGGSVDVVLSVYNPNGYRLDATKLTYRLLVGDSMTVGAGELSEKVTVQDKDSTIVRVPVSFTYAGIGAAGRDLMNKGSVDYKVVGDITVATPVGDFTRPYTGRGRFSPMLKTR
jgi:LEA14-like dessication related protein